MMTIKDLASKIQGNVLITVMTSDAMWLYEKGGKLDPASKARKQNDATLIEFQSQYWNMIKDDIVELDVTGLRMVGYDCNNRHPGIIVYADVSRDDEPITEELMVETEAELIDALDDDTFDRIRLACNIDLANKLMVCDTTKTIDLAEHTLSIDSWNQPVIQVGEDAELTITGNGVVHGNAGAVTVVDGGKVTLEDGAYICGTASNDIGTCVIYVNHGRAVINGGAFSNSDTHGELLCALEQTITDAVIECHGGKFIGEDPAQYAADGCTVSVDDVDGVPVYTVAEQ